MYGPGEFTGNLLLLSFYVCMLKNKVELLNSHRFLFHAITSSENLAFKRFFLDL